MAENSQNVEEFREGSVQFSANVYRKLLKANSGNLLACPLSVQVVLALLQSGAKGTTAQQLFKGLHLPENVLTFMEILLNLQSSEECELTSANKIYVKNNFNISDQYKSTADVVFNAEIENIDFGKKREAACEINRWIEEKTESKIRNIITENCLDEDTSIILINTMFFEGKWVESFPYYATTSEPFYVNCNTNVTVEMMKKTSEFKYCENPDLNAKFLKMSYMGTDVTMTFVLPNDKDGLSALEERITDVLAEPNYKEELVEVEIPKFKIEASIMFKPILMELGITEAFGPTADFSGIVADEQALFISEVLQKTFIEVHEEGTTAGAATIVGLRGSGLMPECPTFIADHPFVFYLQSPVGIMFVGRYLVGLCGACLMPECPTFIADHPFVFYLKSPVGIMFVGRYVGVEK